MRPSYQLIRPWNDNSIKIDKFCANYNQIVCKDNVINIELNIMLWHANEEKLINSSKAIKIQRINIKDTTQSIELNGNEIYID